MPQFSSIQPAGCFPLVSSSFSPLSSLLKLLTLGKLFTKKLLTAATATTLIAYKKVGVKQGKNLRQHNFHHYLMRLLNFPKATNLERGRYVKGVSMENKYTHVSRYVVVVSFF